jgi:hypothetical protein
LAEIGMKDEEVSQEAQETERQTMGKMLITSSSRRYRIKVIFGIMSGITMLCSYFLIAYFLSIRTF